MPNTQELENIIGQTVMDNDGDKIGRVHDIYMDEATGQPEWLAVETGLFGTRTSFVPLTGVSISGGDAISSFSKDQVKDAPHCEADGSLSQEEEAALYAHYNLNYSESNSDSGLPAGGAPAAGAGHDTSGPNTDNAMTRSEEEMRVSKTTQETGRARLRKYLVTEQQTVTVPVTREEVRLEREPITDANIDNALSGPDLSEEEHEVVLHEEQVNVDKVVVPKERVRLDTETVVEDERVSADLRKEEIEFEGDAKK